MKITDDMLTEWFDPDTKPVHRGVYKTELIICGLVKRGFSYWNGKQWSNVKDTAQEAAQFAKRFLPGIQFKYWKGLKEKHHG
ncbi:hypothetical protein [Burkholderia multivorans]|uniref:hypothetical protein n=1 Tax=Burkholderia multivorans TaxID=87883 RepID=UPI00285CE158|nr:hypothetical protein [Burkholderia multivorans]MDR8915841.1 hypothetical protein [Burkholderia multivorans]MDR8926421.1 hypothetical protein [Burkholderia multivorans]MDR8964006.1 hypothetical protein [Burkholderia multivorans]MDR8992377.1 hypothetical protein [Burkholderia multivorans]MDR9019212.1 hypothetical protein [Burkholderia multivorans]